MTPTEKAEKYASTIGREEDYEHQSHITDFLAGYDAALESDEVKGIVSLLNRIKDTVAPPEKREQREVIIFEMCNMALAQFEKIFS